MISFKPITPADKELFLEHLLTEKERGCEYSFANLCLWGKQSFAKLQDHIVVFTSFHHHKVYPFPLGNGNKKPILDALFADAKERGLTLWISSVYQEDMELLEKLYPGKFTFHCKRDSFDYVYDINDLADLSGRKYHKKRNHLNRFKEAHPNYQIEPLSEFNLPKVKEMLDNWYKTKLSGNPESDFAMEQIALKKAFDYYRDLNMEGLVLIDEEEILAFTLGSRLNQNTFDVHFEKARSDVDGAYTAINYEFARHIRNKFPEIMYLNREEDMGLEGLRKAKQSYYPHHMTEKCWACLKEEFSND